MDGTREAASLDLDSVVITSGQRTDLSRGFMSILEAAALWGGEEPGFEPQCVSPVLATFVGMWSEGLSGPVKARRQELKRSVPSLTRSVRQEVEEDRIWMIGDWLVRSCAATTLAATEHPDLQEAGRRLGELDILDSEEAAIDPLPVVREAEELVVACHDEHRPDAYLAPGSSWQRAVGRVGALAAWNAVVDPVVCSHEEDDREWRPEALVDLSRHALRIVEQAMGLVAQPAARTKWYERSTTPPFARRSSGVPGPSWVNKVDLERRRHGQHAHHAGTAALAPFVDAQITSAMDLLGRLLELTDQER